MKCEWEATKDGDYEVTPCVREAKVRQFVENLRNHEGQYRNLCKFHATALAGRSGLPEPIATAE